MNNLSDKILELKNKWFNFAPTIKDNLAVSLFLSNNNCISFDHIIYNILIKVVKNKGFHTLTFALEKSSKEEQEKIFDEAYRLAKLWIFI